jgi:hypothetical protein
LTELKQAIGALTPQERRDLMTWLAAQDLPVEPARPAVHRSASLQRAVMGTLLTLMAFASAEGFLFHSGWYNKYLEPDSMAGEVEYYQFWLRRMWPPKVPDVMVLGDSRIGEGMSERDANAAVGGRVHFTPVGMPGSAPRVWYYMLRDMEKDRNRFSAIVIALDRYSDLDGEDMQDRREDMNYLAGRLTLRDCWDFAHSFLMPERQRSVLTGCVFRGVVFRQDVMEFLSNIHRRLERSKDWRNSGAGYIAGYGGKPETMTGMSFDPATRTIHFPPGAKDWQINSARSTLTPDAAPQRGLNTAYRQRWLGAILDLYKNSKTRIVFLQLPNAPLPVPDSPVPARFLQSIASRPNVTILPVDTFREFQRPELFADGLHLNQYGRKLFSEKLAREMAPLVEAH